MAGKELYIQPILAESLDGVQQIAEKMVEIETQFTQSIRIQSNILANTGLTQNQKVYSGSDLSELTLSSNANGIKNVDITTANSNSAVSFNTSSFGMRSSFNSLVTVKIKNVKGNVLTFTASGDGLISSDTRTKIVNSTTITRGENTIDISEAEEILFSFSRAGSYSMSEITISNVYIDGVALLFYSQPSIAFNSNNEIAPSTPIYNIPVDITGAYAKIAIPTISEVGMWSSCLINGDLTGITLSIVDTTSGNKLLDLAGAITDISTLSQLTNFSVKAEFGEGSENSYISAIIFRYY